MSDLRDYTTIQGGSGEDPRAANALQTGYDERTAGSSTQGDLFHSGGQIGYDRRQPTTVAAPEPERKGHRGLIITSVIAGVGVAAASVTAAVVLAKPTAPNGAPAPRGVDACAPPNVHVPEGFLQYVDYNFANVSGPLKTNGYEVIGNEQANETNPSEWVEVSWQDTQQQLGGYGIVFQDMRTGETWLSALKTDMQPDANGRMTVYVPVGRTSQRMMVYTVENPYRYPVGPATNQTFTRFTVGSTDPKAIAAAGQAGKADTCVVTPGEVDRAASPTRVGTLGGGSEGDASSATDSTDAGAGQEPGESGPVDVGIGSNSFVREISVPTTSGGRAKAIVTVVG